MRQKYSILMLLVLFVTACQPIVAPTDATIGETTAAAPAATLLDAEVLANATYMGLGEEAVTLTDGTYEDSATQFVYTLLESRAEGDIDGDGVAEVAVLIEADPSATAHFLYLAVMAAQDGVATTIGTIQVGDRVMVEEIAIADSAIQLDLVVIGPGDADCCATLRVQRTYRVENNALVQTGSRILGSTADDPNGLTASTLANATYLNEYTPDGQVTLAEGEFINQEARIFVTWPEYLAYTDLDGDGVDDAALVHVTNGGGTGNFYQLAAVLNAAEQPNNVAVALLGDRVQIQQFFAIDGTITVQMLTQGPGDGACCPTLPVTQTWALQDGALVLTASEEGTPLAPTTTVTSTATITAAITGVSWQLVEIQYMNDTVETPADPSQYTLLLNEDGSYAAQVDCNQANGTYTLDGAMLTFGAGTSTLAACPPESLSDQYLQGLTDATSFVLENGDLFIAFGPDAGILHFTAAAAATAAVIEATFVCPDGTSIPAVFDNGAGTVTVTLPDGELTLPQVVSGSGARYSDGTTTFWNNGNEALVEVNGETIYEGCVAE